MLNRRRQAGMGLVDMMIAMTLGLMLMAGLLTTYVSTIQGHNNVAKLTRLDHELQGLMDIMTRDIRRAGSNGNINFLATGAPNPFTLSNPAAYKGEAANSCLIYSYDLDADGTLDTGTDDERFGFRLKNKTVQMRRGGLDCVSDGKPTNWENITEEDVVEITELRFTNTSSTNELITSRKIEVVLSGRLKNDPTVSRTLTRTIRVRNDLFTAS